MTVVLVLGGVTGDVLAAPQDQGDWVSEPSGIPGAANPSSVPIFANHAQSDLSRKLTEAIWHMLTRNQPSAPARAPFRLAT
jgi:hypothetical protein